MRRSVQLAIGGAIVAAILLGVAYQGFQSTVFYYTPAEVLAAPERFQGRAIRLGALVEPRSTEWDPRAVQLHFRVTEDSLQFIPVVFDGVKPDLFREGQGVVVEGRMGADGVFHATSLLVKHSEEYSVGDAQRQDKERVYRSLMKEKRDGEPGN
jgi:cytochrome c-type biogenesis protein CcmE